MGPEAFIIVGPFWEKLKQKLQKQNNIKWSIYLDWEITTDYTFLKACKYYKHYKMEKYDI